MNLIYRAYSDLGLKALHKIIKCVINFWGYWNWGI